MTNIKEFNWNKEYIIAHALDDDIIQIAGIKKLDGSEVYSVRISGRRANLKLIISTGTR